MEKVMHILDRLNIRGFTMWEDVQGRGSDKGEPHYGTHTWPAMNSATLTVVEEETVPALLDMLKKLNSVSEKQGLRAFVWQVEETV